MMSLKQDQICLSLEKDSGRAKIANIISIPIDLSCQLQENIDNSFLRGEPLVGHVPGCSSRTDINLVLDVCLKGNVLQKITVR